MNEEELYPDMDHTTVAVLKAAGVKMDMLPSLDKEDLRDLFPGPENFLRRKNIWNCVHGENETQSQQSDSVAQDLSPTSYSPSTSVLSSSDSNLCSLTPQHSPNTRRQGYSGASKTVQLVCPEYVLYTDTELELARREFFERQRAGHEDYIMSKDLRCRLIRNTVTSMITIKRANGDDFKYPCPRELTAMAKCLIEYYPMLRDKSSPTTQEWELVKKQLLKRVQNVTTPKKKQGATPSRKRPRILNFDSSKETRSEDSEEPASSPASVALSSSSTIILEKSTSATSTASKPDHLKESPQSQARHYKTLYIQTPQYKKTYKTRNRANKEDASQLLDLEFQARRAFIDSDTMKEQDRPMRILQAYPCFKELSHLIDELQRILDGGNPFFTMEVKKRWLSFFNQAQFYGVFKKIMGPPVQDQLRNAIAVMTALPQMFPSQVAMPKKLAQPSEALIHVLESAENPNIYLKTRPLISPVVVVCETNCILAVGAVPLLTFPKEDIEESMVYLLACYYTFHLTYPKCIATVLSVLQTEVLLDTIHEDDMTSSYKKAVAEWRKFNN